MAKADDGKERSLYSANDYDICECREIEVCPGDKLMVRANVKGPEGCFINGEIVKVSGFDAKGRIMAEDGRILDARILSYGYASTSHKSQGSTCDAVILGIDARSAANLMPPSSLDRCPGVPWTPSPWNGIDPTSLPMNQSAFLEGYSLWDAKDAFLNPRFKSRRWPLGNRFQTSLQARCETHWNERMSLAP